MQLAELLLQWVGDLNFPAGQGPKAYYKAPMPAGIVIGAVEAQKINSAVISRQRRFLSLWLRCWPVEKFSEIGRQNGIAAIFGVSMVTFSLIWVLAFGLESP
jgi:hypothetical protein